MNVTGLAWDFVIGAIYVAIVYTLVRPNSPAAATIKVVSSAMTGLVRSTTGYHV